MKNHMKQQSMKAENLAAVFGRSDRNLRKLREGSIHIYRQSKQYGHAFASCSCKKGGSTCCRPSLIELQLMELQFTA